MRSQALALASLSTVLLLLVCSPASAALNLSLQVTSADPGVITDAGTQVYEINAVSGGFLGATVLGYAIPGGGTATLTYHLDALVSGLSVSGTATFELDGVSVDGHSITVTGSANIDNMSGQMFPLGCSGVSCTSEIPLIFNGTATSVSMKVDTVTTAETGFMLFESAYFNPFGNPIFFGSQDGFISVITSYSLATIQWHHVVVGGDLTGTYNGNPVTGRFVNVADSSENLVAGTESDSGALTFSSMDPAVLDAAGTYTGSTMIPTAGEFDCSSLFGLPEGTCTATGASSNGAFDAQSQSVCINGRYSTTWSVPSVYFNTTITGNAASPCSLSSVPEFPVPVAAAAAVGLATVMLLRRRAAPLP